MFLFHFSFFFCNAFLHPPLPLSVFISVIRAWYCSARLVAFFCRRVFIKDKMIHIHVVRRRHTKNSEWGSKDLRRRKGKKKKKERIAKHNVTQRRYTSVLSSQTAAWDHDVLLRMDVKLRNDNRYKKKAPPGSQVHFRPSQTNTERLKKILKKQAKRMETWIPLLGGSLEFPPLSKRRRSTRRWHHGVALLQVKGSPSPTFPQH